MTHDTHLRPLAETLAALARWLEAESIPGAIVGGVAASLLGRPRMTRDVDLVVLVDDSGWEPFPDSGARFGFTARIEKPIEFAHRTRVLLLRHDPTGTNVDISLGALEFEHEIVERSAIVTVAELALPVITAEDLIIMKALARRPRDFAHIESVLDANPDADLDRIRYWLREFSTVLEMSEIRSAPEKTLTRTRSEGSKNGGNVKQISIGHN